MNWIKRNRLLSILLIMILFSAACEKSEDESKPSISITNPINGDAYFSRDTILVKGTAYDDTQLDYIKIVLEDDKNMAVSQTKILYPDGNTYTIDFDFILDEPTLSTGTYSLAITASDGNNSSSEYISLQIKGITKEFEKALILCKPNTLKTYLYSIDLNSNVQSEMNLEYAHIASALNSWQRKLYMIKPQPSVLLAYDLDDLTGNDMVSAIPPYPVFNDVYAESSITYLASGNGDIIGVNHYEQIIYNTDVDPDTEPLLLYPFYNYMLSFCRERGGSGLLLKQHYIVSGVFRLSKEINFSVNTFSGLDSDRCLLFANKEDGSVVYEYGPLENYIFVQKDLPAGNIIDVAELSGGDYIISHENGLYYYSYNGNTLLEWIPGLNAEVLTYDGTNDVLYASVGNIVYLIRVQDGTVLNEVNMPFPVLNMHIQYTI